MQSVQVASQVASQGASQAAIRLLTPAVRSRRLWTGSVAATGRTTRLFGLRIADTSVADASEDLIRFARVGRRTRVVFANAHVINEMAADPAYRRIAATADLVFADGSGMAIAAKLADRPLADNVNGTDLFPRLAQDALAAGLTIFLLGGRPGTAEAARDRMTAFGLGQAIAGCHHGYFAPGSPEEDHAIAAANASGAGVVLVAMGVPLQDAWIARAGDRLQAPVRIGVGGLFDFFAGNVTRAPHAFRAIGCEWVWRLAQEPRRMARRYLIGNLTFMARALAEAWRIRSLAAATTEGRASTLSVPRV